MNKAVTLKHIIYAINLIVISPVLQAKILICTFSYNKPEFIELQYKTFKKFLQDDHEFVVFNDATEPNMIIKINQMCQSYNIKCIDIPQEIHERPYLDRSTGSWFVTEFNAPSVLYSNVAQYAIDTIGMNHDDILVIFEADLFLIKEFSFYDYLNGYDLAGYNRQADYKGDMATVRLLWIGLTMLDLKRMPNKHMFNLNCGTCNDITVDCGGHSHFYLKHNPTAQVKYFNKIQMNDYYCSACEKNKKYRCTHNTRSLKKLGFNQRAIDFIQEVPIDWGSGVLRPEGLVGEHKRNLEFFLNNNFLHFNGGAEYANGSYTNNFNIKQFYIDKKNAFLSYINDILR